MKKTFCKLAFACGLLVFPALFSAPAKADHCDILTSFCARAACECVEGCQPCGVARYEPCGQVCECAVC